MRPEIPDPLAERISNIYEEAGYANRGELVRDAVRHRLRDLEGEVDSHDAGDALARETVIQDADGIEFGVNPDIDQRILIDRFSRPVTPNAFFAGDIGSGKSASIKAHLAREIRERDDLDIVMIDPLQGFTGLNAALGGSRIVVGDNAGINPLEIRETPDAVLSQMPDLDPYAEQFQQAMAFLDAYQHAANGDSLADEERSVLERALQQAYANRGITRDPDTHAKPSPTPADVVDVLSEMARNPADYTNSASEVHAERIEEAASKLVVQFYPLVDGKDDNFSRQTEIELEEPVTYLDLQQQSTHGRTGLMLQLLFTTAYEEAKQTDGETIIVVDEAHYLLETEAGQRVVESAVRHSRHHDIGIVLSCQSPCEFVSTDAGAAIVDNCSLVQLHRSKGLSEEEADALRLPDAGAEYVRAATPGTAETEHAAALLRVEGDWIPLRVTLSEAERAIVDFDPREDDPEDIPDLDDVENQ